MLSNLLIARKKVEQKKPITQEQLKEIVPDEFDDNFVIFGDDLKRIESLKVSESKELWKDVVTTLLSVSGRDNITYTDYAIKQADEVVKAFEKRWPK